MTHYYTIISSPWNAIITTEELKLCTTHLERTDGTVDLEEREQPEECRHDRHGIKDLSDQSWIVLKPPLSRDLLGADVHCHLIRREPPTD